MAASGPAFPRTMRQRIQERRKRSQLFDVSYRVLRERRGQIAVTIIVLLIVSAFLVPAVSEFDFKQQIRDERLKAPTWTHPFGTDELSRDLLVRTTMGLRVSLWVSGLAVAIGAPIGIAIGYAAGYFGGRTEAVLMRLIDTMLAFPGILTAIIVLSVLGTGTREVALALGIGAIPVFARLARGQMLQEKERDYVMAARALGASPLRVVLRHAAPNTLPPLLVQAALVMAFAVIAEATLNFLGLGASPPTPTIGILLAEGRRWLTSEVWWYLVFPTGMLSLILISLNFLADAIVEATNPYSINR